MRSARVEHDRVTAYVGDVSRTRAEFQDECNINMIMKRYEKTGVITHYSKRQPVYLNLDESIDFHHSMNLFVQAEAAFMRLPATVRKRFGNDAAEFVKFAEVPENLDQMRAWGLAPPAEEPPAPTRVEVVNPVEPAPAGS